MRWGRRDVTNRKGGQEGDGMKLNEVREARATAKEQ